MDKKPSAVKEATIERELVRRVEALGGVCEKVMCVGKRGFFDRLIILPVDQWSRGPRIIFAELKRPKRGRIAPHQQWYHDHYKALGVEVYFVRNSADIDRLLAAP
jgi:hypothetical protein